VSYLVRIIATRRVEEEADVMLRVPDYLERGSQEFDEYVTAMVYDIAEDTGSWQFAETIENNWEEASGDYTCFGDGP
jgi:hypothetical protein